MVTLAIITLAIITYAIIFLFKKNINLSFFVVNVGNFPVKIPNFSFLIVFSCPIFYFYQNFNLLQYLGFGANRSQAVNRSSQNILWLSCYRIQALIHSYIILFHSFIYFSFVHSLVHSFAHLIFFSFFY